MLGVLPGVIGLIQAVEAIKLLLGRGEAGDRPDRYGREERTPRRPVPVAEPGEEQRRAEAGQYEDGRLREPHEHGAGEGGARAPAHRRGGVPKPERQ